MSILRVSIFALPALLYLLAWWLAQRRLAGGRAALAVTVLALLAHAVAILSAAAGGEQLRFGFAVALSATLWLGVALLSYEGLRMRIESFQRLILPAAAVASVLPLLYPGATLGSLAQRPLMMPHLLVGTLAYGVLLMAAVHAGLMTAAERALHRVDQRSDSIFARWVDELPPLLVLERVLFRMITVGFVLLTLTAASGIWFSEAVFGRPLRFDHKTLFTIFSWLLFGLLLVGRWRWGWRGRTALRLTLAGFVLLMLAYVGSRFVMEAILGRT